MLDKKESFIKVDDFELYYRKEGTEYILIQIARNIMRFGTMKTKYVLEFFLNGKHLHII